ncbi:MAG: PucR family transcriptional regulator [Candidatus Dormibacteraceae bacterium]
MTTLREVVGASTLGGRVTVLSGIPGEQQVAAVEVVEEISEVETVAPHGIVLLTQAATQRVEPYRLDMAIRIGLHRRVAALTLVGPVVPSLSRTGRELTFRGGPVVLQALVPIAQLVLTMTQAIEGAPGARVRPIFELMLALRASTADHPTLEHLLQLARKVTGVNIDTARPRTAGAIAVPVHVDGKPDIKLFSRSTGDPAEDQARELVLQLVADSASRVMAETIRAEHLPILSQSELLTELLALDEAHAEPLVRRARGLGIPVDGWHVVTRLDFETLLASVNNDEIAAYELREDFIRRIMQALRGGQGSWHHARSRQDLLFIHTVRHDPGPVATKVAAKAIESALEHVLDPKRALVVRCGVGGLHAGPLGLRASALESRASVAQARLHNVANHPVMFDAAGVRRGLIEWYTSDAARESAKLLLAPFDRLDARGRDTAIRTLSAYLDAGGSLAKAAQSLLIHRNGVAYRIKSAIALLRVDLNDPEQRLMLHLACRAELLATLGVP